MFTDETKHRPHILQPNAIHLQLRNCCSSGCRNADYLCKIGSPNEMCMPLILPWMIEWHERAIGRISCHDMI